jgi:hypothetical protein
MLPLNDLVEEVMEVKTNPAESLKERCIETSISMGFIVERMGHDDVMIQCMINCK